MKKWQPLLLKLFFLLLACMIMTANLNLLINSSPGQSSPEGYLNLSKYGLKEQGRLRLDGEWQFYHSRFIKPVTYSEFNPEDKPDVYITPPTVWNYYEIEGKPIPGFGYGSYRMIVTGVTPGERLSIKILPLSTAFRVYIDTRPFAENGVVSNDPARSRVVYHPEIITFTPMSSEFVVTIYVSNYVYARGGMWDAPILGTAGQIEELNEFIEYRDAFLLGCYLIMFLLCLAVFLHHQKNRAWLYFALLCIVSTGRVLIYGDHFIRLITQNFRVITFIEYSTRYWYPILLLLLFNELLSGKLPKKLLNGMILFVCVITIATAILPIHVYTAFARAVMSYDLVLGIITGFLLLYPGKRVYARNQDKPYFIIGVVALYASAAYDMYFATTAAFEMIPIGFFITLLASAFVLAINYAEALNNSERALQELKIESERKLQTELKLLQSQIRPHFLYNALSAIANICKKDGEKAERLILDLAYFMQASFDFTSFDKLITLENELEYIHKYVEIEQARFGDKIKYRQLIEVPMTVQLPRLIIEPLVENAIRHGIAKKKGGGEVELRIFEVPQGIRVEVYDNGIGMSEEKRLCLLSEESKGVGLKNIHDRLIRTGSNGLRIESIPDQFTRVSFMIRREERT